MTGQKPGELRAFLFGSALSALAGMSTQWTGGYAVLPLIFGLHAIYWFMVAVKRGD